MMKVTKKSSPYQKFQVLNSLKIIHPGSNLFQPPKIKPKTETRNPAREKGGKDKYKGANVKGKAKVLHYLS